MLTVWNLGSLQVLMVSQLIILNMLILVCCIFLSIWLELMLYAGCVPDDFAIDITVPMPKKQKQDRVFI